VPPTYRKKLSSAANTTYDWTTSGLSFSGKALWVISTSALLLGIPWALAFSEEQQMQEMEREMRMQQGANEVLTGGAQAGELSARPAL
jgi:import receptor subunit TOM22